MMAGVTTVTSSKAPRMKNLLPLALCVQNNTGKLLFVGSCKPLRPSCPVRITSHGAALPFVTARRVLSTAPSCQFIVHADTGTTGVQDIVQGQQQSSLSSLAHRLYPGKPTTGLTGMTSRSLLSHGKLLTRLINQQHSPCTFVVRGLHLSSTRNQSVDGTPENASPPLPWLPSLMKFPHITWPNFLNVIKNWIYITFMIKPYFDKEFDLTEFSNGAKHAVCVVANKLSAGQYDELEGLVEKNALEEIKYNLSSFTVFQQQLLSVAAEDMFFVFPYQVGIILPDNNDPPSSPQRRYVEITMVFHVLRGLAERRRQSEKDPESVENFFRNPRNKYDVMICNYRFFKDFTEGARDPSWMIVVANHFLPAEDSFRK